ncbi:MAG: ArnT family glycosyltransferase [bacterium]
MLENKKNLLIIILFTLASRLIFLHWNAGEYTDGVIQMTLFTAAKENSFYPPLYTWLILLFNYLFHNLEVSAKLVSMVAGTLTVIPVYLIAKRLFDERVGIFAAILFAVSPELWRWQIRIMTDSLFTLLFLSSICFIQQLRNVPAEASAQAGPNQIKIRNLCFAWLFTGLATLTRYQGIVLIPPLLIATVWVIKQNKPAFYRVTVYGLLSTAVIPWLILIWWILVRGFGHFGQYAERTSQTWWMSLLSYLTMAETFVLYIPYELTYPIFCFFIYGVIRLIIRKQSKSISLETETYAPIHRFNQLFLYLFIVWLIIHAPFESFQYRYFIPIFPLFIILAAYGIVQFQNSICKRSLGIAAIIFSLLFSLTALYFQRDTFGDIKRAAIALKESQLPKDTGIYGNEIYRPGMNNLKLAFWSGLPIQRYDTDTREQLKPGDYVVLHNVYGNLISEQSFLQTFYDVKLVYRAEAKTIPLLPDIMSSPPFTSHPAGMVFKYFPQEFITVIFRIEQKHLPN